MKLHRLAVTKKVFNHLIRFALLVAFFAELFYSNWLAMFVIISALILTFVPRILEEKYKINLPEEFEIWIVVFIYLTLYLGDVQKFYAMFWWWDVMLHGFSAISIGIIGFIVMLYLQQGNKVRANPFLICLFAFSFTLAIGALWEIFEFSLDQIFGFTTQDNSLVDTMWDLVIDGIGALIGSSFGYVYLKDHRSGFAYTIRSFVKLNSFLFKKIKKDVSKNYNKTIKRLKKNIDLDDN